PRESAAPPPTVPPTNTRYDPKPRFAARNHPMKAKMTPTRRSAAKQTAP
ncbi:hypothetical protein A2U01_0118196, partial [Trifolium medium]|nr:hypothetical protein [Trifolium medium]